MKRDKILKSALFKAASICMYAALLLIALPAPRAASLDYQKRWEGKLGGESQYFVPQRMIAGDFLRDPGQELLIIDNDGYAYFMGWKKNKLITLWITNDKVISGRILALTAADMDNDGQDEAIMLDRKGKLSVLEGEKKKFASTCADCLPGAYKKFVGEFIAPAQADNDPNMELLLLGRWADEFTALLIKNTGKTTRVIKLSPLDIPKGEPMSLLPATTPSDGRFYLHIYQGQSGDLLMPLTIDDEGISPGTPISLKKTKLFIRSVFAADINADTKNDIFVSGSTNSGETSEPVLMRFLPGKSAASDTISVPTAMADAAFLVAPDLNGDGIAELLFADYSGEVSVYSLATLSMAINGKTIKAGKHLRIKGGRPFIAPSLVTGLTTKKTASLILLRRRARAIIIDLDAHSATLKVPDEEEPIDIHLQFIAEKDALYIDALSLAEHLGITASWDMLNQTLSLKY